MHLHKCTHIYLYNYLFNIYIDANARKIVHLFKSEGTNSDFCREHHVPPLLTNKHQTTVPRRVYPMTTGIQLKQTDYCSNTRFVKTK